MFVLFRCGAESREVMGPGQSGGQLTTGLGITCLWVGLARYRQACMHACIHLSIPASPHGKKVACYLANTQVDNFDDNVQVPVKDSEPRVGFSDDAGGA